ncbi:MAG: hypothetical protein ACMUIG_00140 [Thermoplasmatota archaeon]
MKRSRFLAIFMITMFAIPLIPLISEEASAGKTIFSTSIKFAWNDTQQGYSHQVPTDIEVAPSGRIYAVFHSRISYYYDIMISHSDDLGRTWSPQARVDDVLRDYNESNDQSHQKNPSLLIAPNGTVYVAWQDERDVSYTIGHQQDIRIAWAQDGENFSRSQVIDQPKAVRSWYSSEPEIAMNDEGRILCVWRDLNLSGVFHHIWSAYSDDFGITWSLPVRINTDPIEQRDHKYARMSFHGDHAYVTWEDNREDGQLRPYLSISADGGETWSPEVQVTDDLEPANSRGMAWNAVDDQGNLYLVWWDKRTGKDEIWFCKSGDYGASLTKNKRITFAPDENGDFYPTIHATGDGILAVAFQRETPKGDTTDGGDIYYIQSVDGGDSWTDPVRVDDSDRYWEDMTLQTKPVVTMDHKNRAMVVWDDRRDYNEWGSDAYFARYSGGPTAPNILPEISLMHFTSMFPEYNSSISSAYTNVSYRCLYRDDNNDLPMDGYPRVYLYADDAGTIPVVEEPQPMHLINQADYDFMDTDTIYEASFNCSYEGRTWWKIEVVDQRGSDPVVSDIIPGPLMDDTPPKLTVTEPQPQDWLNSDTVICRVLVEDTGGGQVNNRTIKVRKSVTGLESMEKGVKVNGFTKIDDNTYEAWARVEMEMGKDNYIVFEAMDRVANGPGLSEPLNLWIDPEGPYYTKVRPSVYDKQLYATVNCSIVWMDHLPGSTNIESSGLNISSLKYRYRTTTGPMTEWRDPEGIIPQESEGVKLWTNIEFEDKGVYNYIQWKAEDMIGLETISPEFRIEVEIPENYPPRFVGGAYPFKVNSSRPHLWWEDAFDEEGDPLFYSIMIMDYPSRLYKFTRPLSVDERTFYDVKMKLDPGYYLLQVNVTDNIGGFGIMEHIFQIVDDGTPPPQEVGDVGPYFRHTSRSTVSWPPSPSESEMDVTYMIRMGSHRWRGDITEWMDIGPDPELNLSLLNLGIGAYSLQVMAHSNGNYSQVREGLLKISDYTLIVDHPVKHTVYRGRGATKGKALIINLTNMGEFEDNVTVYLEGELADLKWAEFSRNYRQDVTVNLESKKNLSFTDPTFVNVLFFPPEDADKGTYELIVRVVSEDDEIEYVTEPIEIKITDAPSDSKGIVIADNLYKFLTDTMPFLKPIPKNLLVPLFLIIVAIIIIIVAYFGITFYRRMVKRRTTEDPYSEQKRVYKELYGVEPTKDQLEQMIAQSDILNEDRDVNVGLMPDKPDTSEFSETYLESEKTAPSEEEDVEEQEPPEEEEEEETDPEDDEGEEEDFITPDSV